MSRAVAGSSTHKIERLEKTPQNEKTLLNDSRRPMLMPGISTKPPKEKIKIHACHYFLIVDFAENGLFLPLVEKIMNAPAPVSSR
jgi:hypothetical protein